MCGISGFVRLAGSFGNHQEFLKYYKKVNAAIAQRGPDCFGLWGQTYQDRGRGLKANLTDQTWERAFDEFFENQFFNIVLANFRGIPTTEFLAGGSAMDRIQPYCDPRVDHIVTHNGQLSNDDNLNLKYDHRYFTVGKDIDSYYFIRILEAAGISSTYMLQRLSEVEGSYAVAAFRKPTSTLYFMRSFLGLFFAIWEKGKDRYLVWASEREALQGSTDIIIEEMPLNSILELRVPSLHAGLQLKQFVKNAVTIKKREKRKSCVVVLSGGLDSTTCLAQVVNEYDEIHLLHFKYGARAEAKEVQSVIAIYEWFTNKYPDKRIYIKFIDLDFIKKLGGSTLTDHSLQIAHGELAIESAHEWVPARNLAMIGLATSYCDRYDIGAIILGLNREESGVYSDNSSEFYQRMEAAIQIGSKSQPKLVMPLGNSMKHHIWKKGRQLGAPLHLSWSCYQGLDMRCGTCGPCSMRQRAAAMNGEVDDLVAYKEVDPVAIQIYNKVRGN